MNIILCSILLFSTISLQAIFYHITSHDTCAYLGIIAPIPKNIIAKKTHSIITECFFLVPHLITQAMHEQKPVLLCVSDQLHNCAPIAPQAPWIEGARITTTWARCYMLNTYPHVYIMYTPAHYLNDPMSLLQPALHLLQSINYNPQSSLTIQNHLFHFNEYIFTHDYIPYQIHEVTILQNTQKPAAINPMLPMCKPNQLRFVITGAAGCIGRHVTQALLEQGHQVIALDNFSSSHPDNIACFKNNPNFFFELYDITKPFTIDGPIDYVVHLASLPSPAIYYTKPYETLMAGLHGTLHTLECARTKNARYLFASTSEVYGDPTIHPQPEWYAGNVNPIGKRSAYDESKRGGETLITWYVNRYHIDARIARIFNTYGPYMQLNDGRVITNFIRAALHNNPMPIYGTGKQTRSFCYVTDTVEGLLLLLNASFSNTTPLKDRVFNIGNTEEYTIEELAHTINITSNIILKSQVPLMYVEQPDDSDPHVRKPDLTRAKTILGFNPHITLTEGLQKTFNFFIEQNRK